MKMSLFLSVAVIAGLFVSPSLRAQDTQPPAAPAPQTPAEQPAQTPEPKAPEGPVHVLLKTTHGDILLELNQEKAPISTRNFLAYTDKKFYDGTIFHRVIPGFMVQGGGFTADMEQKKTDAQIKNEWQNGLKNTKGSIAMARLSHQPDSATAQFFINTVDNPNLDRPNDGAAYAVFGKVVSGMNVVEKIERAPTTVRARMPDVPVQPIVIQTARRLTPEEAAAILKPGSPG